MTLLFYCAVYFLLRTFILFPPSTSFYLSLSYNPMQNLRGLQHFCYVKCRNIWFFWDIWPLNQSLCFVCSYWVESCWLTPLREPAINMINSCLHPIIFILGTFLWSGCQNQCNVACCLINSNNHKTAFYPDGSFMGGFGNHLLSEWWYETLTLMPTMLHVPSEFSVHCVSPSIKFYHLMQVHFKVLYLFLRWEFEAEGYISAFPAASASQEAPNFPRSWGLIAAY